MGLLRYRQRRARVVAGNHHRAHAGGAGLFDAGRGAGPRRVVERDQPHRCQVGLGLVSLGQLAPGDEQDPQSALRPARGHGCQAPIVSWIGETRQHHFGRSLGIRETTIGRVDDDAHALALRIEGLNMGD